jgi:hypothetical protein
MGVYKYNPVLVASRMVKIIRNGGNTSYELEKPSTLNLYFLIVKAIRVIEKFCETAVNPELPGAMPDIASIDVLRDKKSLIVAASNSLTLLGIIRSATTHMRQIVDTCKRLGVRRECDRVACMMLDVPLLYKVFVLGFADICCTMDGGDTLINQEFILLDQNDWPCMYKAISKYPHLSDWVKLCNGEKWENGMDANKLLLENPIRQSILQEVWFMTSPNRSSTMQPLELYEERGHDDINFMNQMIDDVLDQMD